MGVGAQEAVVEDVNYKNKTQLGHRPLPPPPGTDRQTDWFWVFALTRDKNATEGREEE